MSFGNSFEVPLSVWCRWDMGICLSCSIHISSMQNKLNNFNLLVRVCKKSIFIILIHISYSYLHQFCILYVIWRWFYWNVMVSHDIKCMHNLKLHNMKFGNYIVLNYIIKQTNTDDPGVWKYAHGMGNFLLLMQTVRKFQISGLASLWCHTLSYPICKHNDMLHKYLTVAGRV